MKPGVKRVARLLWLAAAFYSVLTAAALLWSRLSGAFPPLFDREITTPGTVLAGAMSGVLLGLGVVLASRVVVERYEWARELLTWFAQSLGPLSLRDAFLLAAFSSVGEELFFRGAMQPVLGIHITSIIFGLVHLPMKRSLWPWTAFAVGIGYAFGLMVQITGNLAGPLVAHFLINALNLAHIGRYATNFSSEPTSNGHRLEAAADSKVSNPEVTEDRTDPDA